MDQAYLVHSDYSRDHMIFAIADVNLPWWDELGKGIPMSSTWREMALELEPGFYSDSPTVWTGTLAFSRRSWKVMREVVGTLGEAFDLHGPAGDYVLFNPLVNELVLSQSANVKRFDDGRLMFVSTPVLRRDSVEGLVVGMLKEAPGSEVYVGQPFVDAWQRGGFVGLAFDPVPTAEV